MALQAAARFCAAIALVTAIGSAQAQTEPKSSALTQSRPLLEIQLRQLFEDQRSVRASLSTFSALLVELAKVRDETVRYSVSPPQIDDFKASFVAFADFLASTPGPINDGQPPVKDVIAKFQAFERALSPASNSVRSRLRALERQPTASDTDRRTIVDILTAARESREGRPSTRDERTALEQTLNELNVLLINRIYAEGDVSKASVAALTENLRPKVAAITVDVVAEMTKVNRERALVEIGQAETAVRTEIEKRNEQLKQLDSQLSATNEQIAKVATADIQSKTAVDERLTYAVYGMIGVLLIMFLSLRLFKSELASEIISRRALVEVVGIAFLLITIIILGTGEKLERAALAALLGTIAGYVFARGADALANPNNGAPPPRPGQPAGAGAGGPPAGGAPAGAVGG